MVNLAEMRRNIQNAAGIQEAIEKARLAATRSTTMPDGLPHVRKSNSKVEAGAVKIAMLEEQHAALLAQIEQDRAELAVMISGLADYDQKAVMRLRYLKGYKPELIAAGTGLSIRCVFYKLGSGKIELARQFPGQFTVE